MSYGGLPNSAYVIKPGEEIVMKEPWAKADGWPAILDEILAGGKGGRRPGFLFFNGESVHRSGFSRICETAASYQAPPFLLLRTRRRQSGRRRVLPVRRGQCLVVTKIAPEPWSVPYSMVAFLESM